ncbi:aldehyde dehydrogenase family protein [Piscibacillus salipiscarius]|uniref:aldehyde dehydrogenase family protein n=1 Tax=Piscibacillus salipiscarius TaxID=299480 RepID=UPI000B2AB764
MTKLYELYVDGKWFGQDLDKIDVVSPATQEVIAQVPKAGKDDAVKAVDAAEAALESWSKLTAEERGQYLETWHQLIDDERETLGKLMTEEQGKPLKEAIGEVKYANGFINGMPKKVSEFMVTLSLPHIQTKNLGSKAASRRGVCDYTVEFSGCHDHKKSGTSISSRLYRCV